MNLLVTRHGETTWNELNRVCGRTDAELTARGIAQAKALALEAKQYHFERIISSPLKRAVGTSEIIAEVCNVPVIIDNRLIEQDYGIYEGVDRKDTGFLENKRNFAYKYPGGESMLQVARRVYEFIDEIKEKYAGKNVLLVSHGGVCRIIHTYFEDMKNDEFFRYTLENCKLKVYPLQSNDI